MTSFIRQAFLALVAFATLAMLGLMAITAEATTSIPPISN